jgi:ABC-type taurine transport system ATPase subunit
MLGGVQKSGVGHFESATCHWLLLTLDRHEGNELTMTKQLVANVLGTSGKRMRQGAHSLHMAGLIEYAKGKIRVLNRKGVEKRSSECRVVVRNEYDRLLPQQPADLAAPMP